MKIKMIEVSKIKEFSNSRASIKDLSVLMKSIKNEGLLHPITVSPVKGKKDYFFVVAGHRRFNALKKLGKEDIPCVVKTYTTEDAVVVNLVENLQREGTTLYEEGRYFFELLDKYKMSISEVSVRVGVNKNYIESAVLIYNKTPKEFREKVFYANKEKNVPGKIPVSVAKLIIALSNSRGFSTKEEKATRTKLLFDLASKQLLNERDMRNYSSMLVFNPDLSVDEFLEKRKNIDVIRFDVPILKSEMDELRKKYNLNKTEIVKGLVYGIYKPLTDPFLIK